MFEHWSKYDEKTLSGLYHKMYQARLFEETLYFLFLEGKIPGSLHQSQGQEAVSVGVCSLLNNDDVIYSTHRPHSDYIAKGADMTRVIAEILGRRDGCCKGKGGSMHICDLNVSAMPAIAVVGGNVPLAAGSALAFKLKGTHQVAVSFTGDGASNEGAWHEALNLAAVNNFPVLFVTINNQWASSTTFKQSVKIKHLSERAAAYGIPGVTADGMDVLAVREAIDPALQRARIGKGPTLLEFICYRFVGHSRSDPANYRSKEEVEEWKKRDPIMVTRAKLIDSGVMSTAAVVKLEKQVKEEINMAVSEADKSPVPAPEECLDDVYA
jgi:acetoin:2,6-dichlorophenolindophenol oxidoreductase subunit alpha